MNWVGGKGNIDAVSCSIPHTQINAIDGVTTRYSDAACAVDADIVFEGSVNDVIGIDKASCVIQYGLSEEASPGWAAAQEFWSTLPSMSYLAPALSSYRFFSSG